MLCHPIQLTDAQCRLVERDVAEDLLQPAVALALHQQPEPAAQASVSATSPLTDGAASSRDLAASSSRPPTPGWPPARGHGRVARRSTAAWAREWLRASEWIPVPNRINDLAAAANAEATDPGLQMPPAKPGNGYPDSHREPKDGERQNSEHG